MIRTFAEFSEAMVTLDPEISALLNEAKKLGMDATLILIPVGQSADRGATITNWGTEEGLPVAQVLMEAAAGCIRPQAGHGSGVTMAEALKDTRK